MNEQKKFYEENKWRKNKMCLLPVGDWTKLPDSTQKPSIACIKSTESWTECLHTESRKYFRNKDGFPLCSLCKQFCPFKRKCSPFPPLTPSPHPCGHPRALYILK